MKLKELSIEDLEQVRQWRNECLEALRTPFPLTKEQQEQFYKEVICNRNARARYWGIFETIKPGKPPVLPWPVDNNLEPDRYDCLIGMCGLENIEWENRRAEISIILNPEYQRKGYGVQAVDLLLDQGFMYLNLDNIWGECYNSNKAIDFWAKIGKKYKSSWITMPGTKYWNGTYFNSVFFNISKEVWLKCQE